LACASRFASRRGELDLQRLEPIGLGRDRRRLDVDRYVTAGRVTDYFRDHHLGVLGRDAIGGNRAADAERRLELGLLDGAGHGPLRSRLRRG
jgi:hypothetical protein